MSARKHSSRLPLATRFATWAFRGIVRMWPADTRDWARGMQSELTYITDARESLRWLQGGVMSLTKAWWNRALFGAKSGERRPLKLPGIGAIAFLLLAIASLALPGMRQGLTVVVNTWRSSSGEFTSVELRKFAARAERDHDSKMLAFVAMHLPVTPETVRWADLAVSLDPNLTWIYFQMDYPYSGENRMTDDEFAPRAARLQQWDPNNAIAYLMQADRLIDATKWNSGYSDSHGKYEFSDAAVALTKSNPRWGSLMDQAFRASRFDDYSRRKFELGLSVMREHKLDRPLDLIFSVESSRLPDLFNMHVYSAAVIREGQLLEAAGDASAVQKYWEVANFAQEMKVGGDQEIIERWIALSMIQNSFTRLQSILEKQGNVDEAKYAEYEVQSAQSEIRSFRATNIQNGWEERTAAWSGVMIHGSTFLMIAAATLTLMSLLWIGLTYQSDSRSTGRKWLCVAGRYSPVVLMFSIVLFYSNYFPYVTAFRDASPDNLLRLTRTYSLMLDVPNMLSRNGGFHGAILFWSGITVVGVGIAAIMLVRMTLRERFDKAAAA